MDRWERLTKEWKRVLDDVDIDDFHMVDCCQGVGLFKGWPSDDRNRLVLRLVNVIKRRVTWRTWTALLRPDFAQVFERGGDSFQYSICAMGCASRVGQVAKRRGIDIPYVFEQGGRGGGYAAALFRKLIDEGFTETYRMGSLDVGDRRQQLPLQAADLHAYEVYKYFADQDAETGRQIRGSFKALLTIPEAGNGGYFFDGKKLVRFVRGVRDRENPIPIALDKLNHRDRIQIRRVKAPWEQEAIYIGDLFGSDRK